MKGKLIFISCLLLITVIGCNSKPKKSGNQSKSGFVPIELTQEIKEEKRDLLKPDTSLIIELMEYYLVADEDEAHKRIETYKEIVKDRENYSQEDLDYYQKNIIHVGKIAQEAIELTKEEKYQELITLLDSELGNFYGHPNTDTETVFFLHHAMRPLYTLIIPTKKEYMEKIISLWEFNRTMIEMVGIMRGEITDMELYSRVLEGLSIYYNEIENYEKKSEVDSILNAIETE